jgi:hypothetical protein
MKEIKNILLLVDASGSLFTEKLIDFIKELTKKNATNLFIHTFDTQLSPNMIGLDIDSISGGGGSDIHNAIKDGLKLHPNTQELMIISDFYDPPLSPEEAFTYQHIDFILVNIFDSNFFKEEMKPEDLYAPLNTFAQNISFKTENFNAVLSLLDEKMSHNIEKEQLENAVYESEKLKSKKLKV